MTAIIADFSRDDVAIVCPRDVPVGWTWAFGDGTALSAGGSPLAVTGTTSVNVRVDRDPSSTVLATTAVATPTQLQLAVANPSSGRVEVTSSAAWTAAAGTYWHEMQATVGGRLIAISGPFRVSEGGVTP